MRMYSYVLAYDTGFAPNPYWGYCTLATCKPQIRKNAKIGDWVIGSGSTNNVGSEKLIYAMKVNEILVYNLYFNDPRFKNKKPGKKGTVEECGDNIYFFSLDKWNQLPSYHMESHINTDTKGINVLISKHFYYFGNNAISIPDEFDSILFQGRGYKVNFSPDLVTGFLNWLTNTYEPKIYGEPNNKRFSNPIQIGNRKS